MADAETFKPVVVPAALAVPQQIAHLAGSGDYLAWTSWIHGTSADGLPISTTSLTVERLKDGRQTKYVLSENDTFHNFQFPILAGHFLVWFTASQNAVLDLQTGNGFDIKLPSTVVGNDQEIALAKTSGGGTKNATPGSVSTSMSSIPLAPDLSILTCQGAG
jgi:hypothetical protein